MRRPSPEAATFSSMVVGGHSHKPNELLVIHGGLFPTNRSYSISVIDQEVKDESSERKRPSRMDKIVREATPGSDDPVSSLSRRSTLPPFYQNVTRKSMNALPTPSSLFCHSSQPISTEVEAPFVQRNPPYWVSGIGRSAFHRGRKPLEPVISHISWPSVPWR